jgi:hypothetical protein
MGLTIECKRLEYLLMNPEKTKRKIVNEIDRLRESLNTMVVSDKFSYDEILKVSQDLDILILQYMCLGRLFKWD